jgi:hypothetical protein
LSVASILGYLRHDATPNLFAIYDLLREPESTSIKLAVDDGIITGYLLRYEGLGYPSVIIRGAGPAVSRLLEEVGREKMLLFLDSDYVKEAETRLNPTAVIPEDLMVVESGWVKTPARGIAKRLGADDARSILELYSGGSQIERDRERFAKWAEKHVVYGVFQEGGLGVRRRDLGRDRGRMDRRRSLHVPFAAEEGVRFDGDFGGHRGGAEERSPVGTLRRLFEQACHPRLREAGLQEGRG